MRLPSNVCALLWLAGGRSAYVTSWRQWLQQGLLALDEDRAAHDTLLPARHRDSIDLSHLMSHAILNGMS